MTETPSAPSAPSATTVKAPVRSSANLVRKRPSSASSTSTTVRGSTGSPSGMRDPSTGVPDCSTAHTLDRLLHLGPDHDGEADRERDEQPDHSGDAEVGPLLGRHRPVDQAALGEL